MNAPVPGQFDPGIAPAVVILLANGVETFESCEGGEGHAFPEPTVRFHGQPAAGLKALAVCMDYGLPVLCLRRVWYMEDGEPTGPKWELVFRHKLASAIEAFGRDRRARCEARKRGGEARRPKGAA